MLSSSTIHVIFCSVSIVRFTVLIVLIADNTHLTFVVTNEIRQNKAAKTNNVTTIPHSSVSGGYPWRVRTQYVKLSQRLGMQLAFRIVVRCAPVNTSYSYIINHIKKHASDRHVTKCFYSYVEQHTKNLY